MTSPRNPPHKTQEFTTENAEGTEKTKAEKSKQKNQCRTYFPETDFLFFSP